VLKLEHITQSFDGDLILKDVSPPADTVKQHLFHRSPSRGGNCLLAGVGPAAHCLAMPAVPTPRKASPDNNRHAAMGGRCQTVTPQGAWFRRRNYLLAIELQRLVSLVKEIPLPCGVVFSQAPHVVIRSVPCGDAPSALLAGSHPSGAPRPFCRRRIRDPGGGPRSGTATPFAAEGTGECRRFGAAGCLAGTPQVAGVNQSQGGVPYACRVPDGNPEL